MDPQVRAAVLTNYREVARSVGLDPDRMLRDVRLDLTNVFDADHGLPATATVKLLEETALQSGCASFGLLLAESRTYESIGAVSLLTKHLRTARDIIQSMIDYQILLAHALVLTLREAEDQAVVTAELMVRTPAVQAIEFALANLCRAVATITDQAWRPMVAHFAHKQPKDISVHRRVFGCPVAFDSGFNGFSMSAETLEAVNPRADPMMALHARRYLDGLVLDQTGRSATERTQRALYVLLPAGRGTLQRVSGSLSMSPRGLQRALESEGQTFAGVLIGVRRELAMRHVGDPNQSITEASMLTGYANLSSFTRWFQGEFGVSPAAWRTEAADGQRSSAI